MSKLGDKVKDNVSKNDDTKSSILVRILIFIVIFLIFNTFQNMYNINTGAHLEAYDLLIDEINNYSDSTKFYITYSRGNNPIIFAENDDKIRIFTYSKKHNNIDTIAEVSMYDRHLEPIIQLDEIAYLANNTINIITVEGNQEKYRIPFKLDELTVKDVASNINFFTKYANLYDEFYYYNDRFIYKVRPDFQYYYDNYIKGIYNGTEKISDLIKDNALYYSNIDHMSVDKDLIPVDDKSLDKFLHTENNKFADIVSYTRMVQYKTDYLSKEEIKGIIKNTIFNDEEAVYNIIYKINKYIKGDIHDN